MSVFDTGSVSQLPEEFWTTEFSLAEIEKAVNAAPNELSVKIKDVTDIPELGQLVDGDFQDLVVFDFTMDAAGPLDQPLQTYVVVSFEDVPASDRTMLGLEVDAVLTDAVEMMLGLGSADGEG